MALRTAGHTLETGDELTDGHNTVLTVAEVHPSGITFDVRQNGFETTEWRSAEEIREDLTDGLLEVER